MRKIPRALAATVAMTVAPVMAADSWKGQISDAMCNAKHADGEHGTKKMTDQQCVEACVKGVARDVFIGDGDKVYNIANQKLRRAQDARRPHRHRERHHEGRHADGRED